MAQAVLRGETRGYRNHPQLQRFRESAAARSAISAYLKGVYQEAEARGYRFDKSKIAVVRKPVVLPVTSGQVAYEWNHLLAKLEERSPALYGKWKQVEAPEIHPLFSLHPGEVEPWERL